MFPTLWTVSDSVAQYEESLACAIGFPYQAGVGCEMWDLFKRHKDLVRIQKGGKTVPDYDNWTYNTRSSLVRL